MPRMLRQDDRVRTVKDGQVDTIHAEVWADRCSVARLITNIGMFMLVWVVVAIAALALMSR